MSVRKQANGRWLVTCRPYGSYGKHVQKVVKTRSQAIELERKLMSQGSQSLDGSLLSECVNSWYDYWGVSLKDGSQRLSKLNNIVEAIGDRPLSRFKPSDYLEFRKRRLDAGISQNTCNHDLVYLKTVFNKLKNGKLIASNPLAEVSPLKLDDYEMSYLTAYQIKRLLVACRQSQNESLYPVVWLCLATGARWSEAEKLEFSQISNYSVRYIKTKNGKSRTVPVDERTFYMLTSRLFYGQARLFANCLSAFRSAASRARLRLPPGQMSHVLRHTFASHFIMNGGDLVTLQRILGHSDIKITMRYAHLSPDHLKDAISFNPLARIF